MLITGEPGSGKSAIAAWLAGAGPLPKRANVQDKLNQVRSAL